MSVTDDERREVDGIGPFPVHGDISVSIWPEDRGRFPVEFARGDRRVLTTTTATAPWLSDRLQAQLAGQLGTALGDEAPAPEILARKVRETFVDIAATLETDDDARRALTPAAVRRVIAATEGVTVYPSTEPGGTVFEVTVHGRTFPVSSAQMGGTSCGWLNTWWVSAFFEPLGASRADWQRIQVYWTDPAVRTVHEVETVTENEEIIERLRQDLEGLLLVSDPRDLVDDDRGWFEEAAGRVWIRSTRIATFVEKLKRPSLTARTLSRICRDAGALTGPSESRRNIGNATGTRRVWPFDRAFAWSGTTAVPAPVSIPILLESMARPGVQ